jgi:hypothetical protein
MFVTSDGAPGPLGTDEQYSKVSDFFTRRKEEVEAEIDRTVTQMQDLVQRLYVRIQSFELSEVSFELGFSAEGHIGFIAKAGAHGTVHVTFKRRIERLDAAEREGPSQVIDESPDADGMVA